MKNILRPAILAGSIALLSACGAKGPLFMPEEAPPIEIDATVESADEQDGDVAEPEEASTPPDDAG